MTGETQSMKATTANTVDEYLNTLPENVRSTLEDLRKTIKSAAPEAEEVISYQMPAYKYHGMLVYFSAFKNHCSFFLGSSLPLTELEDELKSYRTSKGTLQFTTDKPLPAWLVKKIVKARMKQNETRKLAKEMQKASTQKMADKRPGRKLKARK
jgi:uncharacterized protein YdhG (YjbR/CyaY superfamily)